MRLALYSLISLSSFTITTLSAFNSRPNFYSAAIHLGRSSASLMVLANFGVWLGVIVGLGVKRVFFGRLRGVEYEHLFERLWLFLTESLLALTIFRDDFSAGFAMMYGLLVFLKCFHWITADRVDYMDQIPAPGPPTSFHIRIATITTLLSTTDLLLVYYSLDSILTYGVSAKVLFVSEFMVLLASIWGTMARYVVNCLDIRRARGREDAPAWERKSMYMFYIDLAVDFAKLLTYLTFFTVILLNYGIPLHILRDVWMTFRSFISRVSDLIRYRRATRDMDAQYPNATEEDVGRLGDRVCIICREEMVVAGRRRTEGQEAEAGTPEGAGETHAAEDGPNETPKKLVCGHVFHFHCLRSWLERQQSCPTCRRDVLHTTPTTRQQRPAPARPAAAPAPAPAPGAVPQLDDEMRREFEEFFRIPQENGAIPTPAPTAPVPTSGATAGLTIPAPTSTVPTTEEEQIQTSIWGGPIQPGRFFAPPLGSIRPAQPRSRAGPSRPLPLPIRASGPRHAEGSPGSAFPSGPPGQGHGFSSPIVPGSEATTPFSSNPPEVFRSMSSELEDGLENGLAGGRGQEEVEIEGGRGNRRLAAEAAMRRMGLKKPVKGKEKEKEKVVVSDLTTPTEREKKSATYTPYLSPLARSIPQSIVERSPWSKRGSIDNLAMEGSRRDVIREGVEERLKTLKRVDDTIWGLVEELTKMRSLMDDERQEGQGDVDLDVDER